jgi:hypothetical protein
MLARSKVPECDQFLGKMSGKSPKFAPHGNGKGIHKSI